MRDLDDSVRSALKYTGNHGAAVLGVSPGSPAQSAGLEPWDVILSFNGAKITTTSQLIHLVQRTRIGQTVKLGVWRKGEEIELRASISESGGAAPPVTTQGGQGRTIDPAEVLQLVGIQARDLSTHERMSGFRGVVVTGVATDGSAHPHIKAGDLVIAVNNSQIGNANEFFLHLAASAAVQATSIHLIREGGPTRVTLPALPRRE
jgi:serine protease Do